MTTVTPTANSMKDTTMADIKMKEDPSQPEAELVYFTDADLKLWDLTVKAVLNVLSKADDPICFLVWFSGDAKQTEFPEITRPMIPYLFPILNALESSGAVLCNHDPLYGPFYWIAKPQPKFDWYEEAFIPNPKESNKALGWSIQRSNVGHTRRVEIN